MEDTEKVESLNAFFASVFTAGPQESLRLPREEGWRKANVPLVIEGWVREWLGGLNTHKSMISNRIHSQMLRELADVARPLSVIFEKSQRTGEVPDE